MLIIERSSQLTLTSTFTQNLDNSSALTEGVLSPSEVPARVLEYDSKSVTLKLVGGEDTGARRVREEDPVHILVNQTHT